MGDDRDCLQNNWDGTPASIRVGDVVVRMVTRCPEGAEEIQWIPVEWMNAACNILIDHRNFDIFAKEEGSGFILFIRGKDAAAAVDESLRVDRAIDDWYGWQMT